MVYIHNSKPKNFIFFLNFYFKTIYDEVLYADLDSVYIN